MDVRDVAHDVVGDGGADMVAVVLVHAGVIHVGRMVRQGLQRPVGHVRVVHGRWRVLHRVRMYPVVILQKANARSPIWTLGAAGHRAGAACSFATLGGSASPRRRWDVTPTGTKRRTTLIPWTPCPDCPERRQPQVSTKNNKFS